MTFSKQKTITSTTYGSTWKTTTYQKHHECSKLRIKNNKTGGRDGIFFETSHPLLNIHSSACQYTKGIGEERKMIENIATRFIRENQDTIICEPSGRTYRELQNDKVQVFKLMTNIPREELTK